MPCFPATGTHGAPMQGGPKVLRPALHTILVDPRYRRNAQHIRTDYEQHDMPGNVAALLE